MITKNIDTLIDEIELDQLLSIEINEGYFSRLGANIASTVAAQAAVAAGAPLGIGLGILAIPLIYQLYKVYKNYKQQLKEETDKEKRKQIRIKMQAAKIKLQSAAKQEIAKRKSIKQ